MCIEKVGVGVINATVLVTSSHFLLSLALSHPAYGLRHWMEHALGMDPKTKAAPDQRTDDSIVILMDPDMILLRPITHDYSDAENHLWADSNNEPLTRMVKHGFPMAQQDGYLTNLWKHLDVEYIFNRTKEDFEPLPEDKDGPLHWNTGPPYLATVRECDKQCIRQTLTLA